MIKNKRCFIAGGAGSIGQELVRQLAPNNKIFIFDINETKTFNLREELEEKGYWVHSKTGDIRDAQSVQDVFNDFKPQIVINAAALKHVIPNEEYPHEAIQTNIIGTQNLIYESKRWECLEKFVQISTDKVVNAKCIMGITKLCAEGLVTRAGKQFVSVRFGNVMASNGSVLEKWERQFRAGEPLTLTDPNMERYMMIIPESCELIQEALENGKNGEVWVMDMGERIKMGDLLRMFLVTKGKPDYPINIIGLRRGEVLKEYLMTEEEKRTAIKREKFWIINGTTNL
jgi:FlaA1/EpsC-like NDP-sugar epimerase